MFDISVWFIINYEAKEEIAGFVTPHYDFSLIIIDLLWTSELKIVFW